MNQGLFGIPAGTDGRFLRCAELGPFPLELNSVQYASNPFGRNAIVFVRLRCLVADGWAVGDEMTLGGSTAAGNGVGVIVARSQIRIVTSGALHRCPKAGGAPVALTPSSWRIFLTLVG